MSKQFRSWKINEVQLLPPSVQDYVSADHLSRLIVSLVEDSLDLSAIESSYRSGLGQPPYDPHLMTALLLHGYASGLYSSRRIARASVERTDFMMIVAGGPSGLPHDQRVPAAPPEGPGGTVRTGPEARREGRLGKAGPCRAGRHEGQGECVQAQGDELRAHEAA
jgi:hypothetical protein